MDGTPLRSRSFSQAKKARQFFVYFCAFGSTNALPSAVLTDSKYHKKRNILNFSTSIAFLINAIHIYNSFQPVDGALGFDMFIFFHLNYRLSREILCFPIKLR